MTGIGTALVACFIDLEALANAISLGTLQVFTFVNAGVIILRMSPPEMSRSNSSSSAMSLTEGATGYSTYEEFSPLVRDPKAAFIARSLGLVKETSQEIRESTHTRTHTVATLPSRIQANACKPQLFTLLYTLCAILASVGLSSNWHWGSIVLLSSVGVVFAFQLLRLPQAEAPETFACPCVPFVPLMGILCNSFMMGSMPVRYFVFSQSASF